MTGEKYAQMKSEASSSILGRTTVTNARLEVEKFDGASHFGMWEAEVLDVFFQTIEEKKPDGANETEWKNINRLACGTIRSCLSREQKYAFMKETCTSKLRKALEDKFMKKNG